MRHFTHKRLSFFHFYRTQITQSTKDIDKKMSLKKLHWPRIHFICTDDGHGLIAHPKGLSRHAKCLIKMQNGMGRAARGATSEQPGALIQFRLSQCMPPHKSASGCNGPQANDKKSHDAKFVESATKVQLPISPPESADFFLAYCIFFFFATIKLHDNGGGPGSRLPKTESTVVLWPVISERRGMMNYY